FHHTGVPVRHHAIGAVEVEDAGLRVRVGAAEAARVLRVAFDFRGAAVVTFDEHRKCPAGAGDARRVEGGLAGNAVPELLVRHIGEGENLNVRSAAPGQTRETQRRG